MNFAFPTVQGRAAEPGLCLPTHTRAGKTGVAEALRRRGYPVVDKAATDLIAAGQGGGGAEAWAPSLASSSGRPDPADPPGGDPVRGGLVRAGPVQCPATEQRHQNRAAILARKAIPERA